MANPFVHVELATSDVSQAKAFYSKLFDWTLEDVPFDAGTYTVIKAGEGTGGGIMQQMQPGAPSMWVAYVAVDDIHAATARAKSLGASITIDAQEVMDAGWFSILIDPTGAKLGLWQGKSTQP